MYDAYNDGVSNDTIDVKSIAPADGVAIGVPAKFIFVENDNVPGVAACVINKLYVFPLRTFVAFIWVFTLFANVKVKKLAILQSILAVVDAIVKTCTLPSTLPVNTFEPENELFVVFDA